MNKPKKPTKGKIGNEKRQSWDHKKGHKRKTIIKGREKQEQIKHNINPNHFSSKKYSTPYNYNKLLKMS